MPVGIADPATPATVAETVVFCPALTEDGLRLAVTVGVRSVGPTLGLMVRLSPAAVETGVLSESVSCTVKFEITDAVGVPEMMPVPAPSVRPAGSAPFLMFQV